MQEFSVLEINKINYGPWFQIFVNSDIADIDNKY